MAEKVITPCREPWKGTMTDRERFIAQMHYQPFDRSVNIEFGYWQENYEQWSIFTENGITHEGEANEFFAFDEMGGIAGTTGMHPGFTPKVIEESDEYVLSMDARGLISQSPKDGHSTIPHIIDWTIKTPKDWEEVKAKYFDKDHPDRQVDIEELKKHHKPDRTYAMSVFIGSMIGHVRDMLTFEGICYACYDYPEMVEDMVEMHCQMSEHFLDQVLGHFDFDFAAGWEDICYKQGPIVSVPFFRDVVMPRYKRIGKRLKEHGIDIWHTDCDGDVRPILPYFMEAGLNSMFPFEVNCSGHPGILLDEYGKDLRIFGGVDKLALGAGKDAIKEYLESIAPYVERGGFIPFCDHRCPPNVDPMDYIYYLDLKEEMFGIK